MIEIQGHVSLIRCDNGGLTLEEVTTLEKSTSVITAVLFELSPFGKGVASGSIDLLRTCDIIYYLVICKLCDNTRYNSLHIIYLYGFILKQLRSIDVVCDLRHLRQS
jgi:hypothetical protein